MESKAYNAFLSVVIVAVIASLGWLAISRSEAGEARVLRAISDAHMQTQALASSTVGQQKLWTTWSGGAFTHGVETPRKTEWSDAEAVERHFMTTRAMRQKEKLLE